jgi:hypothetical protein
MTDAKPMPPAETGGTEITRFNALKHGVLSRYTVLPWEDANEYRALVRRGRPRSTWSRSWEASCGANGAYA